MSAKRLNSLSERAMHFFISELWLRKIYIMHNFSLYRPSRLSLCVCYVFSLSRLGSCFCSSYNFQKWLVFSQQYKLQYYRDELKDILLLLRVLKLSSDHKKNLADTYAPNWWKLFTISFPRTKEYFLSNKDMSSHQSLINALKSDAIWTQPTKEPYLPDYVYGPCRKYSKTTPVGQRRKKIPVGKI